MVMSTDSQELRARISFTTLMLSELLSVAQFANIAVAKASHVTEPRVKVRENGRDKERLHPCKQSTTPPKKPRTELSIFNFKV
jgi:hypothetical protein